MKHQRSSIRYAKALLDLGLEKKKADAVLKDMNLISNTFQNSKDLKLLSASPVVKADKKHSIFTEIFKSKISELSFSFIELLISKKRINLLGDVAVMYNKLYKNHAGITRAHVTSAYALSESDVTKITKVLNIDASKLEIEHSVDQSIIGGFIIRVGDKQIDTSVKSKLLNIKTEFNSNLYESQL